MCGCRYPSPSLLICHDLGEGVETLFRVQPVPRWEPVTTVLLVVTVGDVVGVMGVLSRLRGTFTILTEPFPTQVVDGMLYCERALKLSFSLCHLSIRYDPPGSLNDEVYNVYK